MTVHNYITNADWCHRLKPTNTKGKYYLMTTYHQLAKACKWIDTNFEDMFAKYIPNYGKFTPMEGYKFPKRVDKPWFLPQNLSYCRYMPAVTTDKIRPFCQMNCSMASTGSTP